MTRNSFRPILISAFITLAATATALAQDFQQTYRVGAGASVGIHNVSGNVKVTGYNGDAIIVAGFKEGRDRDLVSVEDRSTAGNVSVHVRYPEHCNCDASIRFEVQVPQAVKYRFDAISSVSGNVEVSGVSGELRARSVSGEVKVKSVSGSVNASSVSGDVEVEEVVGAASAKSTSGNVEAAISRLEGGEKIEFASVSGNVQVRLPSNLDAEIDLSTLSGSLRTDFPITIEEARFGPGRRARGRVGNGSRSLRLSSTSGNVSLLRY
ncbi:MAG TPA: DUF4097 family beta strand repeat-containing protein [Blastocatellia bacterium]|nr:DUF4097 family beta strand repeat-containing protein [Blastocatellia bacterium]